MKIKLSHFPKLIFCIVSTLTISSCTPPKANLSKEIEALTKLQKQEQTAHLNEEPALLVNMLNDTLTQIKNGEVSFFTKDQMTERLINYFGAVEFITWEDVQPPVYTVSEDGTMAHIIIRKRVEVNVVTDSTTTREETDFAWTELWKKKDGKWKMYAVTTTDTIDQ